MGGKESIEDLLIVAEGLYGNDAGWRDLLLTLLLPTGLIQHDVLAGCQAIMHW